MAVQSAFLDSGLGPLREPAGAWSAHRESTLKPGRRQAIVKLYPNSERRIFRFWEFGSVGSNIRDAGLVPER